MSKRIIAILMIALSVSLYSAERFAILIAGDYTAVGIPVEQQWNEGLGNNTEFWNDLYLQWEMLYNKGYKKENIKVLFAHGTDLWKVPEYDYIATRYRAFNVTGDDKELIVDGPASVTAENGLDDAITEIQGKIEPDDFLYVWAMSHGGSPTQSSLWFLDGELTAADFAQKIRGITAYKKYIVINANYAQGFKDQYWGTNKTILHISAEGTNSYRADDISPSSGYIEGLENELINDIPYYHGEMNFHHYIAYTGQKPLGQTDYDGYNLGNIDFNGDDIVNISEASFWTWVKHTGYGTPNSKNYYVESTPEGLVGMSDYTSFEYPTMVFNRQFQTTSEWHANNFPEKRGLVSVSEDLHIENPDFGVHLNLLENSETTILEGRTITVGGYSSQGSGISINQNAILTGEGNNTLNFYLTGAMDPFSRLTLDGCVLDNLIFNFEGMMLDVYNNSEIKKSEMNFGQGAVYFYRNDIGLQFSNESLVNNPFFFAWNDNNFVSVRDGSVVNNCSADNITLNVSEWAILNHSPSSLINGSVVNIFDEGILNFTPGSYDLNFNVTAGSGGRIVLDNSKLSLNTQYLTMEAGSSIKIKEGSELNGSYVFPSQTRLSTNGNCIIGGNFTFSDISRMNIGGSYFNDFNPKVRLTSAVNMSAGSTLWLDYGSELIIEEGAALSLTGPMTVVACRGSKITVNGGTLETDETGGAIKWTTNVYYPEPDKEDGQWKGIVAKTGSKIRINGAEFEGAETAISGSASSISVTNSTFTNCTNGISLVECNDFVITNNTLTGTNAGTGISIISSDGKFRSNTVENFAHGAEMILSSPYSVYNKLNNNYNYGLYITGYNTIPILVDPLNVDRLNNEIKDNGVIAGFDQGGQIFMKYSAGVYMNEGQNNVHSGSHNVLPSVPCIRGISHLVSTKAALPERVFIEAERNYWGWGETNLHRNLDYFFDLWKMDDPFRGYNLNYDPYALGPFSTGIVVTSTNQQPTPASKQLLTAMRLEENGNYDGSIKLYEQIVNRYEDSPEAYVASSRLPYVYLKAEKDTEPLIATYDEALESENTSNKRFYEQMKITTHIKGGNYDKAIGLAEIMKTQAQNEDEILLADLNLAIAYMMKGNDGKSKSESSYDINELLSKLNGNEKTKPESEPSDITESVLPSQHELVQNYPNPFNPVTQIKFALAKTAEVKLSVYNISGQRVAELANGSIQAGVHAVDFDGSKLNSGIYYYTLEVDGKAMTKKMVLTK